MKNRNSGQKERIRSLINECRIHEKRILHAREQCAELIPLNAESYANLSEDKIEHIDQLVYRFGKLQDAIGAKLFLRIVETLQEGTERLTFIDKLNILEKAGVINSARQWRILREIRNQLAHDYEDDPEEGSKYLNDLFYSADTLIKINRQVLEFVEKNILKQE